MTKPFSQACENNKQPILEVLRRYFPTEGRVLEIGAGTGQHAVHFAAGLPGLIWQPSDIAAHLSGIEAWREEANLPNLLPAIALDVDQSPWPIETTAAVFSANTAHIMAWPSVERMLAGVGRILPEGGIFALYGPFNYNGQYTSESNARFDLWLGQQNPVQGIRDFEVVEACARAADLTLLADCAMPANNRTLVWRRT